MTTPIADFVKKYASSDSSRFHMPGHKGKALLGCEDLDITEISGADVLGSADGIITESESNASLLFGTAKSFYSTEGSTLCIKAMLALIKKNGGKRILAARNVHKAFIYGCALLGLDVDWLYPEEFEHLCACKINARQLEAALEVSASLPDAVYVTSPDYLGNIADVRGLSEVCKRYGVPLLVDNAHGAYLAFRSPSMHPIALGADMCCDSAHKTLPVLTGGAYLHVAESCTYSTEEIRGALSLFASTSPSYLILQSLDLCNEYLSSGYKESLSEFIGKVVDLSDRLEKIGFSSRSDEELKLVFSKESCGYSGYELAETLSAYGIEPEFCDCDRLVLMLTPQLDDRDLDRLEKAFTSIAPRKANADITPRPARPRVMMSIRDALFASSEAVPWEEAVGRICADPTVSCPPAVPVVVSGELIDEDAVALFEYYGIKKISVIK